MEISTITYGLWVLPKFFRQLPAFQSRKMRILASTINRSNCMLPSLAMVEINGMDLVIIPAQINAQFAKALFAHTD
jgi:hypothetical protein